MYRMNRLVAIVVLWSAVAVATASAGDVAACNETTGEAALAACDRAIASGAHSGVALAKLHTSRGVERKRKGDIDGAIADYTESIRLSPGDFFAFNNRANTWRDKGDFDRAFADYAEALKLDPGYTAVYINRGLLYERTKQFEKARADFEEAVKRPPKYRNGPAGQQIARQRLRELGVAAPR
jgi:tetratricopeptide (TPR) repeat protein